MSIPIRRRGLGENIALVFSLLFRNFGSVMLLSLLFSLPGLIPLILAQLDPASWYSFDERGMPHSWGETLSQVLNFLSYPFLIGSLIGIVTGSYTGEQITIGQSLRLAGRKFLHLLLFGIILYIGVVLGLLFLIIPGIIVLCMFYVGWPAIVAEDLTFGEAFGRSAWLTKGQRLGIFAFILSMGVVSFVLMMVILTPLMMAFGMGMASPMGGGGGLLIVIVAWAVGAIIGALNLIAPVVVYFQMRAIKESFQLSSLADLVDRIEARRTSAGPGDGD